MSKRERREKRDKVKAHIEKRQRGSKRPGKWVAWDPEDHTYVFREDIKKKLFWGGILIMWVGFGIYLITRVLS